LERLDAAEGREKVGGDALTSFSKPEVLFLGFACGFTFDFWLWETPFYGYTIAFWIILTRQVGEARLKTAKLNDPSF
jgi:hypothetical protein